MKYLLLSIAVLVSVVQTAPPRKTAIPSNRTPQSVEKQPSSDKTRLQQTMPSVLPISSPPQQNDSHGLTAENAARPLKISELPPVSVTKDRLDKIYVAFSGFLIVIGFFGVRAAYKTLKAIESQVAEMKAQRGTMQGQLTTMQSQLAQMESAGKQTDSLITQATLQAEKMGITADAAKTSADIAARVAIPTLVVEKFDSGETGAANLEAFLQYPKVSITVKNCGQTPAFLKWWTIIFTCEDLPDIPIYSGKPGCGMTLDKVIVEPMASYTLPSLFFPHRQQLDIGDVKALIDREKILNVYGYICYGDLFGNPLRRLKFCETALNLFDGPNPAIGWADFGEHEYTGTDHFPLKKPFRSRIETKVEDRAQN